MPSEYIENLLTFLYRNTLLKSSAIGYFKNKTFEPRYDKTNKISVRPAKTQISLGIRPVWSESSLSACRKVGSLATH